VSQAFASLFPFLHNNYGRRPTEPKPSLVLDAICTASLYQSSLSFDDKFTAEEEYQAIAVTRLVVSDREAPRHGIKVMKFIRRLWSVELILGGS
jgi:hypothetical protein